MEMGVIATVIALGLLQGAFRERFFIWRVPFDAVLVLLASAVGISAHLFEFRALQKVATVFWVAGVVCYAHTISVGVSTRWRLHRDLRGESIAWRNLWWSLYRLVRDRLRGRE